MKIDFVDLKHQVKIIYPAIKEYIEKIIYSANYFDNNYILQFEQSFAKYLGVKYVLGVSSGTDALKLILRYYNLNNNEEVIVPVNTFTATAEAVIHAGAIPVFIDVSKENALLTKEILQEFIDKNCIIKGKKLYNKRTNRLIKGIIFVHLYGQCVDYFSLYNVIKVFDLFIIEDSAQAHGSICNGKKAGTLASASGFSFYPAKNLGAFSDAGCIATNNKDLYNFSKMLKDHGSESKYIHKFIGYTNRISAINSVVLNEKLKYLDKWNKQRKIMANLYRKYFNELNIKQIKLLRKPDNQDSHVYHLFIILAEDRDKLLNYLRENNIGVGMHYPIPLHLQEAYKFLSYKEGDFNNAEFLSKSLLSLPMHQNLKEKEVEYVVNKIKEFYNNR